MVQGAGKSIKSKGKSGGSQKKNTGKTKPGRRDIAPKERMRVLERSNKKEMSSKINHSIEKQMVSAASAGKLTILRSIGEPEGDKGKDAGKAKGTGTKGTKKK